MFSRRLRGSSRHGPTAPAAPTAKVDAFQYFFGRSSQPAPKAMKEKEEPAERKPVDAFEYFFGKDGMAGDASAPAEDSSEPPSS